MRRAGKLNTLVVILAPSSSQDAIGQPVQTWNTLATVFANVRNLTGMEAIRGGAEVSITKASVRINYRADVTATMRVQVGTALYEIKDVLPDEENRERIDLACELVR